MSEDSIVGGENSSLLDVFAFIETFDSDSELTVNTTSSEDDSSPPGQLSLTESDDIQSTSIDSARKTATRKKKRKARQPGQVAQSTRFQREKRDLILALRQQVIELTAKVKLLQRTRQPINSQAVQGPQKPKGLSSVWEDLAILQYQERQRSEQTNRDLKAMLARQRKLEQSISKLLGRKDVLEGMELLCRLEPMTTVISSTEFKIDLTDVVFAELEMTTATLYMKTNTMFPPLQGQPMVSFSTKDKNEDPLGAYIEITTTTPMACPLHVAAEILWEGTSKGSKDPEKVPQSMRAKCYNTLARSCKLDMFSTVRIDGINFVRRYFESNRIVLVSTATWFLPAKGVRFQDNIWTIVSPSPVDPQNSSVVQSFCQFGAHSSGLMKEDIAPAQEYVRASIGSKLRQLQEKQQKYLLEHGEAQIAVC
ncbi:hypothetical protein V7S43_002316 [Phytophthora oleae]|uniref:M96 mating-specific protein family n=1 Tax=Phytophthora oleae TaxID=2107226 RepID=A0ABD3G3G9_9STRA